jgi:hypothetical protein
MGAATKLRPRRALRAAPLPESGSSPSTVTTRSIIPSPRLTTAAALASASGLTSAGAGDGLTGTEEAAAGTGEAGTGVDIYRSTPMLPRMQP